MDNEGLELIIIGAHEDIEKELGKQAKLLKVQSAIENLKNDDLFKQLGINRDDYSALKKEHL